MKHTHWPVQQQSRWQTSNEISVRKTNCSELSEGRSASPFIILPEVCPWTPLRTSVHRPTCPSVRIMAIPLLATVVLARYIQTDPESYPLWDLSWILQEMRIWVIGPVKISYI